MGSDNELYQQIQGLTSPWKVVNVRLEMEGQAVHISLEYDSGSRFRCPKCDRKYGCYDHAPGRTWRHLNTCQFQTLVHRSNRRSRPGRQTQVLPPLQHEAGYRGRLHSRCAEELNDLQDLLLTCKDLADDPQVSKSKEGKALARFMSLHPHNIAQNTDIMLEHFHAFTRHKIGGRAKGMVVTSSRLHAVRFKQEFDRQINEKSYTGIKTLVAFSGTVKDPDAPGVIYDELEMNRDGTGRQICENELPDKFATEEYQLLLVAEKYQTGFDQPFLHTMYIYKRLDGIQAVHTLSRLNRTRPGKEDTFVLDFVNNADDIQNALKPYYEQTIIGEQADARQLYELQGKLESMQVFYLDNIDNFCKVFFKPKAALSRSDHAMMNSHLDLAIGRFRQFEKESQDKFRGLLNTFCNLYGFLSQVIPFQDSDLEKLYTYARFLASKLPHRATGEKYASNDEVSLKFNRLQKISEGTISLGEGENVPVTGPTAVGTGKAKDTQVEVTKLIDNINERFGADFTQADGLFFHQLREEANGDEELRQTSSANTLDNYRYVFVKALEGLFIDKMEQNEEIFAKYMNDGKFRKVVSEYLLNQV